MKTKQILSNLILNFFVAGLMSVSFTATSCAQMQDTDNHAFIYVANDEVVWLDFEADGFAPGAKFAVIHGDPSAEGEPFLLRFFLPDGYIIPPHTHPMAENLTVLSGTFILGMGRSYNESNLQNYNPGDFLHVPGGHPHFGSANGPTVIQIHGTGPFETTLVEDIEDQD